MFAQNFIALGIIISSITAAALTQHRAAEQQSSRARGDSRLKIAKNIEHTSATTLDWMEPVLTAMTLIASLLLSGDIRDLIS